MSAGCRLLALLAALAVGACAPRQTLPPDAALLSAQEARETRLAREDAFHADGRIAVSGGGDGGSGSFTWRQSGTDFEFHLRSPVARRTWSMHFVDGMARLEGLEDGIRIDVDPERLLAEAVGWTVPVRALGHWVRGARAPGRAEIWFDAEGRPARIRQNGWQVDYRDWFGDDEAALPRRVFAERGDARVRVVIGRWDSR